MRIVLIKAARSHMSPLLHALNIGTLATWLSVACFGSVGIAVRGGVRGEVEKARDPHDQLETIALTEDFNAGDLAPSQATETGDSGSAEETEVPLAEPETLPAPPEMPDLPEVAPLPEIPDMPVPTTKPADNMASTPLPPRPVSKPNPKPATRSHMPVSAIGGSPQDKATALGKTGNGGRNGGTGRSDASRLAGGRMPAPAYPSEARAKGQSGTVLIEFIVGEDGRVISAFARGPSPWPILNERAVSTVLRWKFPPGSVAKFTRPIVFKLN